MKSTVERKVQADAESAKKGDLRSIPSNQKKKQKKSLFSMLFSSEEKNRVLLFHIAAAAGLEEALELIRFASSLRGEHRRLLVAPQAMHSLFEASQLFSEILALGDLTESGSDRSLAQTVRAVKADIFLSSTKASFRGVKSVQLKSRNRNYHLFPSFWQALSFSGKSGRSKKAKAQDASNGLPSTASKAASKTAPRAGSIEKQTEKADLQLSKHNLRFRITMRRIFESMQSSPRPIWIPVALDPFTGSAWPFSNYMRLCRMLSQNGIPYIVTIDEDSARRTAAKDREILGGLPVFRKELSLLGRQHAGLKVIESPSLEEQFILARFAKIVVGNPSPELLLAQMGGSQIVFLHDMLTYRSANAGQAEELAIHASYGRSLFDDSLQLGGGLSMKPHVDDCVRDCPACAHNYCVDTISPEAVWEELKLLLAEKK